jgi:hypothetical protein
MVDNAFGPAQTHAMRQALELVAERLRATDGELDARGRRWLVDIVLDVVAQNPEYAADADALAKQALRHVAHSRKSPSGPAKPRRRATEAA